MAQQSLTPVSFDISTFTFAFKTNNKPEYNLFYLFTVSPPQPRPLGQELTRQLTLALNTKSSCLSLCHQCLKETKVNPTMVWTTVLTLTSTVTFSYKIQPLGRQSTMVSSRRETEHLLRCTLWQHQCQDKAVLVCD